ncbi:DUF3618 domain-containing protein [Pelagicoccus sp. SDUM812003]|uniref:DUF3618 domain-containing protein n=1 Tax=Pelagicoccus sp. SDUM812003 TaxID=3041267 RepID=UPI00280DB1E7|nr:DUF3618 domain-containing protein [Pelagicoccus sp. SDUM812003]MDQ8203987.1 DUF3618 domain-containing protein [Pelagicoccus sp. SDUM812003]
MIQENFDRRERSSDQLQRQITATRDRMSHTIHEIGEELNPRHLLEHYVDEHSEALLESLNKRCSQFARKAAQTVKENPIPTLAILIGVALFARGSKQADKRRSPSPNQSAEESSPSPL